MEVAKPPCKNDIIRFSQFVLFDIFSSDLVTVWEALPLGPTRMEFPALMKGGESGYFCGIPSVSHSGR